MSDKQLLIKIRQSIKTAALMSLVFVFYSSSAHARAGVDIFALGSSSTNSSQQLRGLGAGIILNVGLTLRTHIELGGMFQSSGSAQSTKTSGLFGLRYLISRHLFLNGGIYTNHFLKNTQNLKGTDWGPYGGLGIKIPLGLFSRFLISGQYRHGLNRLTSTGTSMDPSEVLALAGFSFGLI